jgi:2-polyprenyl-3-methyl-5-hydroxy-6-metoxy-1,4-benzoquinol methylase
MGEANGTRAAHEIAHGQKLAGSDAERVWGWGTPAGRIRAIRRAALVARGAGLAPGIRALEVGCGTGLFTGHFAETGAEIVAVDISEPLIESARHRGLPSPRVRFLCRRFEDCDVDGPFDAIVGSSVLHHLDLDRAVAKIYSLLRPGGVFSFAEPNMLNPQIFVQKNVPLLKSWLGDSPDETALVRWRFRRFLQATGFIDVSVQPFDWLHPATPRAAIPLVRSLSRGLERLPVIREFAGSLYIRAIRPHE